MGRKQKTGPEGHEENCLRKNHGDLAHARRASHRLNQRRKPYEMSLVFAPYLCPACFRWAVGSLPKAQPRPRADDTPPPEKLRRVRCLDDALDLEGAEA